MGRASYGFGLMLLVGCTTELGVSSDSRIVCSTDAECPATWTCVDVLGQCKPPGFDPHSVPRPEVVFVSPRAGTSGLPETTTVVLVFSLDIVPSSLAPRLSLAPTGARRSR